MKTCRINQTIEELNFHDNNRRVKVHYTIAAKPRSIREAEFAAEEI